MAFAEPKEAFPGQVVPVTIGSEIQETFGGENTLPFHKFEGSVPNRPLIAYEIQDVPPEDWPETVRKVYEGVSDDPVKWARYCEDELKARSIALRLVGTHPDSKNLSADDAATVVKGVLDAVKVPIIIMGSNHVEKDAEVLPRVAEVAKGRNCIIGKAQEKNYKTIAAAAMANDHKLIAMSELDINLSKQLNILLTQMGFSREKIITDPMCSALGYGLEYTYSVMERIRLAALAQNDEVMQPPMLGDVGMYVWKIKETQAPEDVLPEWGSLEERGILWEAMTATSLMLAGAELLIMRHPRAVEYTERFIDELM
ncbi:MAG TPA: acetyl-CoA decarbonylase/synthase complex subunit delta [Nitrospirae bacterium]|nr:acetyl-CoA decarbonylase/synthase complex subunit delta [Nitrospirota bacterium]